MFFRKVPDNGGFVIMAGVEQMIEYLKNLSFTDFASTISKQIVINNQDNAVSYNIFDKQVFINLSQMLSKFEIDDIKFKYETDEEWKKAGLEDPLE